MVRFPDSLTQLRVEIDRDRQAALWQQSQREATRPVSQRQVLINRLAVNAVLEWLPEEFTESPIVWPSPETLPALWTLVGGTAISVGETRFIVVPSEAMDTDELRVWQEWVDIPDWRGDYYLAVQVNLEAEQITVWGYTTHRHLKQQGHYDALDRSYSLESTELTTDLSVLSVVHTLQSETATQAAPSPLTAINSAPAESLIERLTPSASPFTRLAIPFAQWAALVVQETYRQQLHQRQQNLPSTANSRLGQWFQNQFTSGWQAIEDLLNPESMTSLAFRRTVTTELPVVNRARLVELSGEANSTSLILVILAESEPDSRLGLRVQLRPQPGQAHLPSHVELSLTTFFGGEVIQSVQARQQDNYIQLKRFRCPINTTFWLQVTLGDTNWKEIFTT